MARFEKKSSLEILFWSQTEIWGIITGVQLSLVAVASGKQNFDIGFNNAILYS